MLSLIDNAKYAVEREIATSLRSGRSKERPTVYQNGNCPVNHRTMEAALACRNP
jgi:hypothetical protein